MFRFMAFVCALAVSFQLIHGTCNSAKGDENVPIATSNGVPIKLGWTELYSIELDEPNKQQESLALPSQAIESKSAEKESDDLESPAELTSELMALRKKVSRCLIYYHRQPENAATRSPWGLMHAMLAFGPETAFYAGGRKVNAIAWLCWNGACKGQRLLRLKHGRIDYDSGVPGLQGHDGQLLAMLAQCRVKSGYPMVIDGQRLKVSDLVEHEMFTCESGKELTFKLIALAYYLDSNTSWQNQHGEKWSIPRLIHEELAQPINGATCGGTHRMMGFSCAVRGRQLQDEPVTGEWLRAQTYVSDYHDYAFKLQNADGSFSTSFFEGRGQSNDVEERLRTTGHILEWLVFSLPDEQLRDPRVVNAVNYLTDLMIQHHQRDWSIGPKGHALRALMLYNQRVFGGRGVPKSAHVVSSVRRSQ